MMNFNFFPCLHSKKESELRDIFTWQGILCRQCSPLLPTPSRPRTLKMLFHSFLYASIVSDESQTGKSNTADPFKHHKVRATALLLEQSKIHVLYPALHIHTLHPWFQPTRLYSTVLCIFWNLYIMDLCSSNLCSSRVNSSCYLVYTVLLCSWCFKICCLNLAFSNFIMIWLGHLFILLVFTDILKL